MRSIVFSRDDIEYPILFDLEVAEQIRKKHKSLSEAVKMLAAFDMETTVWLLHLMIQEGVLFQNDLLGTSVRPPKIEAVRRLITHKDLRDPQFTGAITDAFNDFMGGNVTGQQLTEAGLKLLLEAMKHQKKTLK